MEVPCSPQSVFLHKVPKERAVLRLVAVPELHTVTPDDHLTAQVHFAARCGKILERVTVAPNPTIVGAEVLPANTIHYARIRQLHIHRSTVAAVVVTARTGRPQAGEVGEGKRVAIGDWAHTGSVPIQSLVLCGIVYGADSTSHIPAVCLIQGHVEHIKGMLHLLDSTLKHLVRGIVSMCLDVVEGCSEAEIDLNPTLARYSTHSLFDLVQPVVKAAILGRIRQLLCHICWLLAGHLLLEPLDHGVYGDHKVLPQAQLRDHILLQTGRHQPKIVLVIQLSRDLPPALLVHGEPLHNVVAEPHDGLIQFVGGCQMRRVFKVVPYFRVLGEPRAVVSSVVPHDISQRYDAILLLHLGQYLPKLPLCYLLPLGHVKQVRVG
eukprot:comp23912_c1_seq1/m.42150 comp23912_c1_seq1/g.42150  ORF comp23912_c1_seq1/g.42150 comp23912_c1_seq1/m.42150 type:complete len:378 (+) comp23912_c1_seq1:1391-2524(+)